MKPKAEHIERISSRDAAIVAVANTVRDPRSSLRARYSAVPIVIAGSFRASSRVLMALA